LRRLAYFVAECDTLYKQIMFDELNYYKDIYSFDEAPTNPVVEQPGVEALVENLKSELLIKDRVENFKIDYSKVNVS
jgi:hypothetical protein